MAALLDQQYYAPEGDLFSDGSSVTTSADGTYVDFGTIMASSAGRPYKVAMIGDSHAVNRFMLQTLQTRLDDPAKYECAIPGQSWIQTYGLGGYTTEAIWAEIENNNFGAGSAFSLVMAGTNDLTHGYYQGYDWNTQLDNMVSNMKKIVERIADPRTPGRPRIIVAGVPPTLDANISARAMEYNERLKNELTQYVDVFFDDNFYDLWNEDTNSVRTELMYDNAHPNNDGNYRIAENWLQGITALFDENIFVKYPHVTKMPDYRKD